MSCTDPARVVFSYPHDVNIHEKELISFIETLDDDLFRKHSKKETIDRLRKAFVPGYIKGDFRGGTGIDYALDDIALTQAVIDAFQPKASTRYTTEVNGTCEGDEERVYNVYYTFVIVATIDEMIDWLVNPLPPEFTSRSR